LTSMDGSAGFPAKGLTFIRVVLIISYYPFIVSFDVAEQHRKIRS